MKRTLISAAVGALFAAAATSSFALSPAATASVSATNQIRVSGATAQDPGIVAIMRRACATNSLDSYAYTGSNAQTVFSCTLASNWTDGSSTINAGTNIVLFKDSALGSQNGIDPFTTGGAGIQFVNLSTLAAACGAPTVEPANGSLIAYNKYTCGSSPTLSSAVTPDIGLADVEPKIFGKTVTGASVASANGLMFGVPVSAKLYSALQTAQAIGTNRPSLSSGQIAALYSGNLSTAGDLGIPAGGPPSTEKIYIARRANTSGTQKTAEVNFLQQNLFDTPPTAFLSAALTGATSTVNPSAGWTTLVAGCGNGTTAPTIVSPVFAGNGSGDVRNCLNQHGSNRHAVGVLSMESNENATGTTWKWVKIDGVMPTVANVIRGSYHHWVEQSILLKAGATSQASAAFGQIKSDLGNPAYIKDLNASFTVFSGEPSGQQSTGIVALPNLVTGLSGGTCSAKFSGATTADNDPVNIATKAVSGSPDSAVKPAIAVCPPRF